ncbi:MAG: formate/nitrite transporter family protein [Clostridium sp.]
MKLETCNNTIDLGIKKCSHYTGKQIAILGLLAGAFTAFGGFAASMGAHSIDNYSLAKFVNGSLFSIGLILVLTCGGELFTGNVLTIQAYLQKKITVKQFTKNLLIVYVFNFLGVSLVSFFIYSSGLLSSNKGHLIAYILDITAYKSNLSFASAFSAGVLCNFLVCLGVWGACGTKSPVAKIFLGYMAITGFIVSGFENSIANMFYFSISLIAKLDSQLLALSGVSDSVINSISISSGISNILPVTLGNMFGGIVFVGVAYWTAYEYIPRKNNKDQLTIIVPEKFKPKKEVIAFEEEPTKVISNVVDISKHRLVYIPEMTNEVVDSADIDLKYKDFESNYFCH